MYFDVIVANFLEVIGSERNSLKIVIQSLFGGAIKAYPLPLIVKKF
jgi:hypothetical protein